MIKRISSTVIRHDGSDVSPLTNSILAEVKKLRTMNHGGGSVSEMEGFKAGVVATDDESVLNDYVGACLSVYAEAEGVTDGIDQSDIIAATEQVMKNSIGRVRNMRHGSFVSPKMFTGHDSLSAADMEAVGGGFSWGAVSNYGHITGPVIAATLPTSFASQVLPIAAMDQPRTAFEIDINTIHHANGSVCRLEDLGYYDDELGSFGESKKESLTLVAMLNDAYVATATIGGKATTYVKGNVPADFVLATGTAKNVIPAPVLDPGTMTIDKLVYKDLDGATKIAKVLIKLKTDYTDSRTLEYEGYFDLKLEGGTAAHTVEVYMALKIRDLDSGTGLITLTVMGDDTYDVSGTPTKIELLGLIPEFAFRNNADKDKMTTMNHHQLHANIVMRSAPLVQIPTEPQIDEDSRKLGYDRVARQIEIAKHGFGQALERRGIAFLSETVAGGIGRGLFSDAKGEGGTKDFVYTDTINLTTPAGTVVGEAMGDWATGYFGREIELMMVRAREASRADDVTWYFVTDFATATMLPTAKTEVTAGPALANQSADVRKKGIKLFSVGKGSTKFYVVATDFLSINVNLKELGRKNTLRGEGADYDSLENGVLYGVAVPNKRGAAKDSERTLEYVTYSINMVEGVLSAADGMNPAINLYCRDLFVNFRPLVAKILIKGITPAQRYRATVE